VTIHTIWQNSLHFLDLHCNISVNRILLDWHKTDSGTQQWSICISTYCKSLMNFPNINITKLKTSLFKNLWYGIRRTENIRTECTQLNVFTWIQDQKFFPIYYLKNQVGSDPTILHQVKHVLYRGFHNHWELWKEAHNTQCCLIFTSIWHTV